MNTSVSKSPLSPAMSEVLKRLGQELEAAASASQLLQSTVGTLLDGEAKPSPSSLKELQQLDHLTQTLFNLTGFVSELAETVPADISTDLTQALDRVRLGDLAHRLSTQTNKASIGNSSPDEGEGDIEFFG